MAYAAVSDMVNWVGQQDLVRLSTPRNQECGPIIDATVTNALASSSSVIDSYLRKRYAVPLGQSGQIVPPEITRCCCILATYELAGRDGRTRGEEIIADYKGSMGWLKDIADGRVLLDVTEAPSGDDSYAQVQTRCPVFSDQSWGGGYGCDGGYP